MYDFHLHSRISFDSTADPRDIVLAAESNGLREICFTDHYDFNTDPSVSPDIFTLEQYAKEYDSLASDSVLIRKGVEFGLTAWNREKLDDLISRRRFDFVIGSVHYVDGKDPYFPDFWEGISAEEAFEKYLSQTLECVKIHDNFDVLGHLNYVCKSQHNPTRKPLRYNDFTDICDEIMKILANKGKGMEINTSGVDRVGEFLPSLLFVKRFKELGGEIVTVGSDAHDSSRVGQYSAGAIEMLCDVFGYVCTFENRTPIFHKLKQ